MLCLVVVQTTDEAESVEEVNAYFSSFFLQQFLYLLYIVCL